jgi:flagellar FliL protein
MMRWLIVAVVALLALGLGAGGGMLAGSFLAPHKPSAEQTAKKPAAVAPPDSDMFYDLPEMLAGLQEGGAAGGSTLRLGVSVECSSADDLADLQEYLPRVLDVFQVYLRSLDLKDLRGTKNLAKLREALRVRIEQVIAPGKVKAVLFRDIVVD